MPAPERPPLGQVAYDAHRQALRQGGTPWADLPAAEQRAWTAAATAAVEAVPVRPLPPATPGPRLSTSEELALAEDRRTFWLPIIAPGGVVDVEQVLLELGDYSHVLTEVPKVYDAVTGGRMTKPLYFARDVIAAYEDGVTTDVSNAETELLCEVAQLFEDYPEDVELISAFAEGYGLPDFRRELVVHREQQTQAAALASGEGEARV
ncbi:hypothetical protein [uncultured Deinococcus sp.]|uniref:hypothetical protein n=1 Tax=uncultured Deinococcus sp. TaxID=158789 RepID=UPI0025EB8393|nr:hypothetical protein [uncultured Deinococcus sp.]